MKVLHIIDHLGLGGAQVIVKEIVGKQKRVENCVYALRKVQNECLNPGADIKIFRGESRYSILPLLAIKRLIMKKEIEILHCHLFRAWVFGWLVKKFWFRDLKLVFHVHVLSEKDIWFLKFINLEINLLLSVSNFINQELIRSLPEVKDKAIVLSNFVDLEVFNSKLVDKKQIFDLKRSLMIGDNELVLGFVGRLNLVKGCKYFIKALKTLHFLFKVVIVGDGPELRNLKKLVNEEGVIANVRFVGYQSDVRLYYSMFDMIIVPSVSEAFGLVALEAQAMGVPIIASNVNGLKEQVIDRETGLLFDSGDVQQLADKIVLLATDNKIRKLMVKNGFKNIKKYSLRNYIKDLEKIYEGI